mmetsp:Transcript_74069/g.197452  ORF Transcript_74069/g.197452 Transcript_74069/m.197452 type:complete len:789 (-) Transcript_74069:308-2674(-)
MLSKLSRAFSARSQTQARFVALRIARSMTTAQTRTTEEEIGRIVPHSLKSLFSAQHTFAKNEVVVVKGSCGTSFFGRVDSVYLPSSRYSSAEYVVCVDEANSKMMREPAELLGKILEDTADYETKKDEMYPPPASMKNAYINSMAEYTRLYRQSIENPEAFWGAISKDFHWQTPWNKVNDVNFDLTKGPIKIKWFLGGKTNMAYNSIDRHVKAGLGDKVAYIWEGNDGEKKNMTYKELQDEVSKFANVLKSLGVKKGDIVTVYLPMILELPITMLACARIGAVHSVVFGGFSSEAICTRLLDAKSKILITADGVMRGSKMINFKEIVDEAVTHANKEGLTVKTRVFVERMGPSKIKLDNKPGDVTWASAMAKASTDCPVEWLDSEDPAFLLYTSGSTGKPKGVIHTTGGYMVWAATTFKHIFDYKPGDVYFCTADCGWITGHSYITYGPTAVGATQVLFEGVPTHPTPSRWWDMVDRLKVTQFYTSPTAIRSLMGAGKEPLKGYKLDTLRVLGSVGEPINPEAWKWYHEEVGKGGRPIVDTWWQTETGGIMLTPLPGATPTKPGSATLPYFGIEPVLLDEMGNEIGGPGTGYLCIRKSWPGQARGVFNDLARFEKSYFTLTNTQNAVICKDKYVTGDACRRDEDGYYWITGRVDDVMNVSGHRISTAEVESALVAHDKCVEAAVVGVPHALKGESIYAFVTLLDGVKMTPELQKDLKQAVRKEIGAFAVPDVIHWAPGLPKTRSGKIMRRVLRKLAVGVKDLVELGDTSTLADPNVITSIMETAKDAA